MRLVLDPGKNHSTAAFATALARSIAGRLPPSASVDLARGGSGGGLPLAGVFSQLEEAHAIICADSFVSHAAPLFGLPAFVVARAGVANWWAPWYGSFYFNGEESARDAAATMGRVIRELSSVGAPAAQLARFTQAEARLVHISAELETLFDSTSPLDLDRFHRLHEELAQLREAIAAAPNRATATAGPEELRGPPARRPSRADLDRDTPPQLLHVRHELESWRNTNYFKYLRWSLSSQVAVERQSEA